MTGEITYTANLDGVDWEQMKEVLAEDDFDNGRMPEQLRKSFENSHASESRLRGRASQRASPALSHCGR